jgi:hypothetical protein
MQNQTETIVSAEHLCDADDAIILIGAGIDDIEAHMKADLSHLLAHVKNHMQAHINRELDHMKHALNLLCRETGRSEPYPDFE